MMPTRITCKLNEQTAAFPTDAALSPWPGLALIRKYAVGLMVACCLASPSDVEAGEPQMSADVERAIVKQTNDFRKRNDLPAVSVDDELATAAADFARFMASEDKYGHRADGRTPAERAKAAGYRYCVVRENIAYRTNTAGAKSDDLIEVFVQGWIDSPTHRENMLADYVSETGVAVATADEVTYYAVQLFGRPKSAAIQLKISNESGVTQSIAIESNGNEDEIELPPRGILTLRRCFPITIAIADRDESETVNEDTAWKLTEDGLRKSE